MKRKTLPIVSTFLIGACSPIAITNISSCHEEILPIEMTGIAFKEDTSNILYNVGDPFDITSDGKSKIPTIIATFKDGSFKSYFYGDEELTFTGFDSSSIGKKKIDVTLNYNSQTFNLSYEIKVFNVVKPVITLQPKDAHVNYPSGATFEVKVKNPEEVVSYQWQCVGTKIKHQPDSWHDLDGIETKDSKLIVPFTDFNFFKSYRCVITNKSGASVVSQSADLIIDNNNEFVNCFYVGNHALTVSSDKTSDTLDLANTNYGEGIISFKYVSETVTNLTFENVKFETKGYECSSIDNPALSLEQKANTEVKTYNVIFKGENVFNNTLWDKEINGGGYTFYAGFNPGSDPSATYISPEINFKKDGEDASVEFIGGSAAICTDTLISCDIDIKMDAKEKRLSKGIICYGFTLEKDRKIEANLGGAVIFAQLNDSIPIERTKQGVVKLEENSSIEATIIPGVKINGTTDLQVVQGSQIVQLNKASINATINIDSQVVTPKTPIMNFIAIGNETDIGKVEINQSNVNIKATTYNDPEGSIGTCFYCYGVASSTIEINGSELTIDMDSKNFCFAAGIKTTKCGITNSKVDITMDCFRVYYGIYTDILKSTYSSLHIEESDVEVNIKCTYPNTLYAVGLEINGEKSENKTIQSKYEFIFDNGSEKKVTINVESNQTTKNAYPITYLLEKKCAEKPTPIEDYDPIFKVLDDTYKISADEGIDYEINLISNSENNKIETFYLKQDGQRIDDFVQKLTIGPISL